MKKILWESEAVPPVSQNFVPSTRNFDSCFYRRNITEIKMQVVRMIIFFETGPLLLPG